MIKIRTHGGRIDTHFIGFSGGERHVELKSPEWPPEGPSHIYADIYSSDDLLDLLLAKNALDEMRGAHEAHLWVRYLSYSRQDRHTYPGTAHSLKVFGSLLNTCNFSTVTTWDVHSDKAFECINNLVNISPEMLITRRPNGLLLHLNGPDAVLVRPDEGAEIRTNGIRARFDYLQEDVIRCIKKRDPTNGKLLGFKITNPSDISGATAIITDDICDGGGTFLGVADELRKLNPAKIILYVTHGIFSKGLEVFRGHIDEVYSTDSWAPPATG